MGKIREDPPEEVQATFNTNRGYEEELKLLVPSATDNEMSKSLLTRRTGGGGSHDVEEGKTATYDKSKKKKSTNEEKIKSNKRKSGLIEDIITSFIGFICTCTIYYFLYGNDNSKNTTPVQAGETVQQRFISSATSLLQNATVPSVETVHQHLISSASSLLYANPPKKSTTSTNNRPLVSAIIPYQRYQRETLLQAIYSVTNQTYSDIEVIVVGDDNTELPPNLSKNDLERILKSTKKNVKVLNGEGNARNYGVEHSSGEFIAFLDPEDAWAPNKIELQMQFALQNKLDFVTTEAYAASTCRYDTDTKVFTPWNIDALPGTGGGLQTYLTGVHYDALSNKAYPELKISGKLKLPEPIWDLKVMEWHNLVLTSNVMMRKSLFHASGGFDAIHKDNYYFWLQVMRSQEGDPKLGYLSVPLTFYDNSCRGNEPKTIL